MPRWIACTLAALLLAALAAAAAFALGLHLAERRRERIVALPPYPVADTAEPQALARGRYLYESRGCTECHGLDGRGRRYQQDDGGTRLAGPNLTPAGAVARWRSEDWERAIRHGLRPDGRPLLAMPSEDYQLLTDEDLAALVAYLRRLPPRPGLERQVELPPTVWARYGLGLVADAASRIPHHQPPAMAVPAAVGIEHGRYVAGMCVGCHGAALSGGRQAGGRMVRSDPDGPPAANLTPGAGSALQRYPDADSFVAMLRSGRRPDGSTIAAMPFEPLARLNDVDAQALYTYLASLPPRPLGQ